MQTVLNKESNELPVFNSKVDQLNDIKATLTVIGNNKQQICLYKLMAPVNTFKAKKHFYIAKSQERLIKLNDDFLRIVPSAEFFQLDNTLFIINLNQLERNFDFREVIQKEALKGIEAINNLDLIEDISVLNEPLKDMTFARKLTKIANHSPVLKAEIPNETIIDFCKSHETLKGKFKFNEDNSKILLNTKIARNLFIKLLMDDFLTSELTKHNYLSLAKDDITQPDS